MEVFILFVLFFACWIYILSSVGRYFGRWLAFQWTLYRHQEDDVCCCGAHVDDHSIWDNHAIKTQREWFIESCKPVFN